MKKFIMQLLFGQCIVIKKDGDKLIIDASIGNFSKKEIQEAATLFFKTAYNLV